MNRTRGKRKVRNKMKRCARPRDTYERDIHSRALHEIITQYISTRRHRLTTLFSHTSARKGVCGVAYGTYGTLWDPPDFMPH